jgi:spore maturation protein CgeB
MKDKKHRMLFLVENYTLYYSRYYEEHPDLSKKTYREQINALMDLLFYHSDSFAAGMRAEGHEADSIIMTCDPLQLSWLAENNFVLYLRWKAGRLKRSLVARLQKKYNTFDALRFRTLQLQVEACKPTVIFVYSGVYLTKEELDFFKSKKIILVLHWSTWILKDFPYESFDLIISSSREVCRDFIKRKLNCLEIQQSFDERILKKLPPPGERLIDVSFIGNIIDANSERKELLEYLAEHSEIRIWGSGTELLSVGSPIWKKHFGKTGGMQMYQIYQESKIALHLNNDGLHEFVGAKRYFEVTGAGTMLMALHQKNILEFFIPGVEIVTFIDIKDCLEKIQYYLAHDEERKQIALAGQQRTLRDHTFKSRIPRLLEEISKLKS